MEITLKSIRTIFTKSKNTGQEATTSEPSNGETSAAINSPSSNTATATHIKGTPFTIVGNKEKGWFIGYGHAQITPIYNTKKEALKSLEYNHWEIICNMITFTVEHWGKLKEQAIKNGILKD